MAVSWRRLFLGALFVSLFVLLNVPCSAQQSGLQLLPLNTDKIRIGDSTADPKPVGLAWHTEFTLTALPKWASLSVEASDSSYANPVVLNGTTLGTLSPVTSGQWLASLFEIALSDLHMGKNTLEVQSASKGKNYDDLYVRNVVLTLGFSDPPSIITLSQSSAGPGTTIILTGKGFNPEDSQVFFGPGEIPAFFTSATQAFFRVPRAFSPGVYPVLVRSDGARSTTLDFTILSGDPHYEPLSFTGNGGNDLPGDVAPHIGTNGHAYGDGKLTIADPIRLLKRVLGLEPDPWP